MKKPNMFLLVLVLMTVILVDGSLFAQTGEKNCYDGYDQKVVYTISGIPGIAVWTPRGEIANELPSWWPFGAYTTTHTLTCVESWSYTLGVLIEGFPATVFLKEGDRTIKFELDVYSVLPNGMPELYSAMLISDNNAIKEVPKDICTDATFTVDRLINAPVSVGISAGPISVSEAELLRRWGRTIRGIVGGGEQPEIGRPEMPAPFGPLPEERPSDPPPVLPLP